MDAVSDLEPVIHKSMSDTELFNSIFTTIKDHQAGVREEHLKELWETLIKYKTVIKNLPDEVDNAASAVKFAMVQQKKKHNGMDVESNPESFVRDVLKKLKVEKLDKINLYTINNQAPAEESTKGTRMVEEKQGIVKSNNARIKILTHKEANEEMGKVVKSSTENLTFKFGQTLHRPHSMKRTISDYKLNNFLYVQPKDFAKSFKSRYDFMENKIKHCKKINFNRVEAHTKNFDVPTVVLARLTYDEEDDFMLERIMGELLTDKETVVQCYLNFSTCQGEFHLFPNAYVAVEVQGDFYDKNSALRVNKIFEIDSELDPADIADARTETVTDYLNIMVFKGPFTLDGNAYFSGFDMIRHHIERDKSINYLVLIGPFVPEDQATATAHAPEMHSKATFKEIREENIYKFYSEVKKMNNNISIIVVPDITEADNIFPYPIPSYQFDNRSDLYTVSSPCLLTFEVANREYSVAIGSQDVLKNILKFPQKSAESRKFFQAIKSIVSQRNLMPVFPLPEPFDVTNISLLNIADESQKPDVFVMCSSITQFAFKARGVTVCNPKTIFDGDNFGHCARIYLDAHHRGSNGVRVDILKF